MLRVGITGPSGAGKSTVARGLEARGFPRIDADRVAHELYRPGSALVAALAGAFGGGVLDPDGGIDRRALGEIVFSDGAARRRLNDLVHPPLVAELRLRLTRWAAVGAPAAVLDAALLLHWDPADAPPLVDWVVGVTASREVRRVRLMDAGLTAAAADRRLDAQVSGTELAARSDVLIVNEGTLAELDASIHELAGRIRDRVTGNDPDPES